THGLYAPCFDFLDRCFLPAVNAMGPKVCARIESYGFFPVGGGRIAASIEPADGLGRLDLLEADERRRITARSCVAMLSHEICQREMKILKERLGLADEDCTMETNVSSPGCGNYLFVEVQTGSPVPACFTGMGKKRLPAEHVADSVAKDVLGFLDTGAVVERHLADQLLLPMALGAGGSFRTPRPSAHTLTNIEVIHLFLDANIRVEQETERIWRIDVG
ncbi:MAG: RNA 3'-terminal phosphate cyclase, partial [Desulfovibrionaceae bacterium]